MQKSIMIVDDEKAITDLVALYLQNENFEVHSFYSGLPALEHAEKHAPDLAILDVMLPDINGFDLCRQMREMGNFPIIMLTAKDEEIDKITGLTIGADDYVTKPFRPLELVARVKAQLRRFTRYNPGENGDSGKDDQVIILRGLVIDNKNRVCLFNEKPLALTPTEFSILWELCANCGQVLRSEDLFFRVWGESYYTRANNTIMVHVRHIREKMGETAENAKYIKTVWGVGYKIEK